MSSARAIDELYNEFINKCINYETNVINAHFLYTEQVQKDTIIFDRILLNLLVEYAFFRLFLSWEYYLEQTFISYSLGYEGLNGKKLVTYVSPRDYDHAYSLVQGTAQYPDWTNADKVLKLAGDFFENGGRYPELNSQRTTLHDIKIIRNALAHMSQNARDKFESLVRNHHGHFPLGTEPSDLLLWMRVQTPPISFFGHYSKTLKYLAQEIATPA
jgi:hypothetical protein